MVIKRDFRTLAPATQAELRRIAVAMVRAGKTRVEAAATVGVNRRFVGQWVKVAAQGGEAVLAGRRRGRRPGEQKALSGAQEEGLRYLIARGCPELFAEVGDGLTGRRRRIVGVFEPPLLQQRSDTPCPMLPWSSCFNQGRSPTRSPRCCVTGRAPCWRKRSRPRWPNFSPSMSI